MSKAQPIIVTILLVYLFLFVNGLFGTPIWKSMITQPIDAFKLVAYRYFIAKESYPGIYWAPARNDKKGVTLYDAEKAYNGLTLFVSSYQQKVHLIDMNGDSVHEWEMPFSKAFPNPPHIDWVLPEHLHVITRTHLYPNGDLLVIYTGVGATPLGYGMAKIDKDSNLLWSYASKTHHDAVVDADGRIYTLSHDIRQTEIENPPKLEPPFYEDFLVLLSPEGEELKKISFYEAFRESPAHNVLTQIRANPTGGDTPDGDTLHPNTATLIPAGLEWRSPILKEGHLLLSFRNMSLLAILDPETEKMTWASYGPWQFQHDPQFMPDGSVVLLDNEGFVQGHGGASRILQVNLPNTEILWQYTGDAEHYFYTAFQGMVDPLPNGNTLVTESMGARLFEVTRDGEIVWEYVSPWRVEDEDGKTLVPAFYEGTRFTRDQLGFL